MRQNQKFSNTLIMWYLMNKRDLPWRKTKDPYLIWLSEIILQQTRIAQGTSYYEKFANKFEDVFALANSDEKTILKMWQGLGYYSRARNLHSTAKEIAATYNGKFPDNYKSLVKLKGIGDYTASAIASMAFDQGHAVVDGNVYRVLSRIFGIDTPINESKGVKEFKLLAQELLNTEDPGTHNQALMEFGAVVCTPKNPQCDNCVFNNSCEALSTGRVNQLPKKKKTLKIKNRFFNFLVLDHKNENTFIRQRVLKDIWQNLFEFPLLETQEELYNPADLLNFIEKEFYLKDNFHLKKFNEKPILHKLSHQNLYATFWIINSEFNIENSISWEQLNDHALPVLIQNFVDKYKGLNQ
ncbi:A/G-specific adenine glycosylase [Lutimonas zeaxanthinifaciens]|uniref:A/G-specific adenine glycosylase n=1 Tax=Lutimonas zeaxanthinifaciens TaxID=3060215 RepID=UPI00265D3D80|nr:A/G-specific adenine glycosylase [Lutimonas sp. YSD2104]WKK66554.1 A/G-specific adenine glycosylase [Lutimonas sp. YSD2104]